MKINPDLKDLPEHEKPVRMGELVASMLVTAQPEFDRVVGKVHQIVGGAEFTTPQGKYLVLVVPKP